MSDSLADTITPRSDQLNADDLLCGPITVKVTSVKRGDQVQPVIIGIDGDRQPYKPCKSMRRVLIAAWGDKGADWVGKSMTLYCDPSVVFGGVRVGGIRISHLSHIPNDTTFLLTTARGKRGEFPVKRLSDDAKPKRSSDEIYAAAKAKLEKATTAKDLKAIRDGAAKLVASGELVSVQATLLNHMIDAKEETLAAASKPRDTSE
jgi:hypothetical protein